MIRSLLPVLALAAPLAAPLTAADVWQVDASHSTALFAAQHFGAGFTWGRFNKLSGTINTDADATKNAVSIAIDAASIDTGPHELQGRPRTREESWTGMAVLMGQWALKGYGVFAVEERATGRFLGRAGILHLAGWPEPELAYALARAAWGHGFATEACRATLDWAWTHLPAERIVSFVKPGNIRSEERRVGKECRSRWSPYH